MRFCIAKIILIMSTLGSGTGANAFTVEQFNALPVDERGGVLKSVIEGAYRFLRDDGASSQELTCFREYFTAQEVTVGGETVVLNLGIEHVLDEFDKARRLGQAVIPIENIVMGVVTSQCRRG